MKQQWEIISAKLEAMSLRERALIFVALAALLLMLLNTLLLAPLFARQKALQGQLAQQQQALSAARSQIAAMRQENSADANSPLQMQLRQLRQQIAEGNILLKNSNEHLVRPQEMAAHLKEMLNRNKMLQLVSLQTLPASTLTGQADGVAGEQATGAQKTLEKQVFKHGVKMTLRGNYLHLLQYLLALEKMPQRMYWAEAQMSVVKYPAAELTLTLYTLSLDKTWLQI